MTARPSPAPPAGPATDVGVLRGDLGAAGFTVDGVGDLLGDVAGAALHREQRVPALRLARGVDSPAATLVRLFMLGDEVTTAELAAALPGTGPAGAQALGLVARAGAGHADPVRATVDLRPYAAADAAGAAHWWVASDLGEVATGTSLRADHVLGIGGASTTLAQLTVRDPRPRVLDLGTGCGVQALHAARHGEHVVATDISARALGFAAFNAALAGTDLDLRRGSLLEPVAGEAFDLVVSNPPFVITPTAAYDAGLPLMEYRDGGRGGDLLVRELITTVGAHLAPGGVAQLLGNWEHHRREDWRDRVLGWLAASGLDGWVVQREVQDPAEYAELWLRDGGLRPEVDRPGYEAAYAAWLGDFEARGVEAVGFGYVLLRRPGQAGRPWHRVEEVSGPVRQPLGQHVLYVLAARDWLAARGVPDGDGTPSARVPDGGGTPSARVPDGARGLTVLADHRFAVAPDVTEERFLTPGASDPQVIQLRQGGGLGRVVRPGTLVAGAVGACDGELTLGQIIGGLAALLDLRIDDVAAEVLPAARELLLDGFLRPVP
ncbi:methyltransferase [Georgenia yuyongxinii]|uniref:Methyltransferase n=1 Tax=Georgenia yuyongxinii TaxID=2589797 RepID=A0A5B8C2W3_9MICO|nr:methyltransferase [Georgenia yuyongxinii]QDC23585.1 methyltransferase [Georgenia yuyongxinii]